MSGLINTKKIFSLTERDESANNNPDKIIFPDLGITKKQVTNYYQTVGPVMIRWIYGHLLTLVRFPNGISNPGFFQKNAPSNTPHWIQTKHWGIKIKKDYVVATTTQTLAWLASMGTVEFHIMGLSPPQYKKHTLLFFDLDPPGSMDFQEVLSFSELFHEHLKSEDLNAYIKTSGKNGIHLICPLIKNRVRLNFEDVRALTQSFLLKHPGLATTELRKGRRGQRLFIDIYRNHPGQTLVAPLSLRATPLATVSMPLEWGQLKEVKSPTDFNLSTVLNLMANKKWQPWKNFPKWKSNPA